MDKKNITRALVATACFAAVFLVGLYFGRTGGPGGFTVTTQYEAGAVSADELDELTARVEERAAREEAQDGDTSAAQIADPPEAASPDGGLVNINTADVAALTTLPGVGPAIAERIISHRETHGPFRIIEEITDVSGIGEQRFLDIQALITVD